MQKIDKNTSLTKFLKNMAIGEECIIPEKVQRYHSILTRASALRKQGYDFRTTVKGLVCETKVTKLANPTN